ncbi:hypothetical protein [Streptomyces puniciscabiei]|uniref:hypothetical protein n=1 Tax=Streptomyces puniciscabiei TaxID=164348 RepID=UPI003EB90A5B
MRELNRRAFPEPETGLAPLEDARAERRRQADASRAAAVRRARAERERAGGRVGVQQPPTVRRTA